LSPESIIGHGLNGSERELQKQVSLIRNIDVHLWPIMLSGDKLKHIGQAKAYRTS
jgi:hypothetical protein